MNGLIMEIRAAAGGNDAKDLVDLFERAYTRTAKQESL